MPTLQARPTVTPELEERIEAFEQALGQSPSTDLADFLPPADHATYRETLGELIRVEVELLWVQRTPRPLETYIARFPQLQRDPALLGAIAFEEYRQRLQAGEEVSPDEYRRHFGLELAHWPGRGRDDQPTHTQVCEGVTPAPSSRPGSTQSRSSEPKTALPEPGDVVLRRFRIKEALGKGAFGSVFLAERLDLFDRPVALKFLRGPSVEPAMLAQLIHENVIPIESADRFGSLLVICMPYRGRTTLQHVVDTLPRESIGAASTGRMLFSTLIERSGSRSRGSRPSGPDSGTFRAATGIDPQFRHLSQLEKLAGMSHVEAVLRVTLGVVNGLAHAHEHNIVHRDLKPANVLLSDDGTPMILDFNLATQIRKDRPLDCVRMGGTFPYMAPEQIEAGRDRRDCRDPRSDLYSLGVMLYELLTGSHPFPKVKRLSDDYLNKMVEARRQKLPDPCAKNSGVPRSVADIIHKLLAFDAAKRYQSARDLKEDLERELSDRPLKFARESSLRRRTQKFRRRHPRLIAAATVGLAATLLLFVPAGVLTGVQVQKLKRQREVERLGAKVLRDDSLKIGFNAQTMALSRGKDSRLLHLSLDQVEQLCGRYAITPDTAWDERPEVSRLDDAERRELIGAMGQTFLVVSEAASQQAIETNNDELRGQAERWKKLADSCFGKIGRTPGSLSKSPQPPIGERKLPDLAKLDEADLYTLASDLLSESRHRSALIVLDELTARNPQHFMAWFWKATCYDNLGNDSKAVVAWTACTALQPTYAVCRYNLGVAAIRCNQFAEAEREFDEAFRLDPKMVGALLNRGACKFKQKKFADAEREFTEVLAREDAPTLAWFYRSAARQEQGKMAAAAADEAEGLRREPNDELGYSMRGYKRLSTEPTEALADLDRALAINPRNRDAMQNKIHALEKLRRTRDAIAACDIFLRYYPDMLAMHAGRGVFLARVGDTAEAVKAAELCLNAAPPNAKMLYQIGSLYAQLSGHDVKYKAEALRLLQAAVRSGLDRIDYFQTDEDLAPLKAEPEFRKLADFAGTLSEAQRKVLTRQ